MVISWRAKVGWRGRTVAGVPELLVESVAVESSRRGRRGGGDAGEEEPDVAGRLL